MYGYHKSHINEIYEAPLLKQWILGVSGDKEYFRQIKFISKCTLILSQNERGKYIIVIDLPFLPSRWVEKQKLHQK